MDWDNLLAVFICFLLFVVAIVGYGGHESSVRDGVLGSECADRRLPVKDRAELMKLRHAGLDQLCPPGGYVSHVGYDNGELEVFCRCP